MKAIILAAGKGTRMGKYTENLPKGMLNVNGKTLIQRQIEILQKTGITDIAIVTGYEHLKINYNNIRYFHNPNFDTTNMIESLMCAKEYFINEDVLICYSDILYTDELVKKCIENNYDIGVAVDSDWRKLWKLRYGKVDFDLESLSIKNGNITELGKEITSSKNLEYRYIGMIKLSKIGTKILLDIYNARCGKKWKQSGKPFEKGYMTDILSQIIDEGTEIKAIITKGNWLEFDTAKDYEILSQALNKNLITEKLEIV